ncbi:MAG: DoxX family membrane protein [Acidobacteria bacterium]|nr:DoxX family membrane protein [Acidobacteriota bacterium]
MSAQRHARVRTVARVVLGVALALAGFTHLTAKRLEFQAQVPDWVPMDKNLVVVLSGLVEIGLGVALLVARTRRPHVGLVAGLFFIAIFPGNISQYVDGHAAFGLDSDGARLARLFFQPVLVGWAWWCTGATALLRRRG